MKKHTIGISALIISALCLTGCHEKSEHEKMEERAEAKVGKIYNHKIQGEDIGNHDNQFFISRLKEKEDKDKGEEDERNVNDMSAPTIAASDSTNVKKGEM
ncbi:hypothetical protein GCM10007424_15320 [Flavobacterium suaedae]|uniref:Lipoprotein n=1 Tax=Flavobacterium suaedae TaxID=1767027 RepID=A0ABQ1JS84_9FLAO|nr:hypothetical protein [Flavobacterium suaedae]GGB76248.1 hypothetical protein GCM10007424_15320 [Flavobacterium suaedae]